MEELSCIKQYILDIMQDIVYTVSMETPDRMKLRLARVENGLSQQALAERVGVTRQTIGLIEKGGYNPTLNLCLNIARELDKTLDELFWEEDTDA